MKAFVPRVQLLRIMSVKDRTQRERTSFVSRLLDFLTDLLKVFIQLVLDDGVHRILQGTGAMADQTI